MSIELSQVCVVILSRDRHQILLKSLAYWMALGVNVVVVHKTTRPLSPNVISRGVTYINSNESYALRCGVASQNLVGEYCIVASDDELYLPSALTKMAKNLENDKTLFSVGGQALAILGYGRKTYLQSIYKSMWGYENLSKDTMERVEKHFYSSENKNFNGAMYRMFRKTDSQDFLHFLSKLDKMSTPYIYEVSSEIFCAINGPSIYLNEIFWLRNWIEPQIQSKDWDRKLYFSKWYRDPNFRIEMMKWRELLTTYSLKALSEKQIDELIIKVVDIRTREEMREIISEIKKSKSLKRFIPGIFREITAVFRKFPKVSTTLINLNNDGITYHSEEVKFCLSVFPKK